MLRSVKYGLYGAVLAGLIGAPVAWNSVDKSVHLVVDGKVTTFSTTASDVSDVLDAKGYEVTSHDLLAPSATSEVHDGMRVVLRRGRLLHLNVDGSRRAVWTTARTVHAALGQLGYSASDFVSVSRSQRLPLRPTDLAIRTPRVVTVVHDGKQDRVTTTDANVGEVLRDISVTVRPADRLSASPESAVTPGEVVRLQRVGKKTVVNKRKLGFKTVRTSAPALPEGTKKIVTKGRKGKLAVTYSLVFVDGKEVARTKLASRTVLKPRNEVIKVGTKPLQQTPASASGGVDVGSPSPGSNKAIAKQLLAQRGWGSDDQYSCLVQMWDRESGWRTDAANPSGAYGIPQALPGSKMASAGPDWQSDATTQIKWGLGYIASRYDTPCGAWSFWQAHGWY